MYESKKNFRYAGNADDKPAKGVSEARVIRNIMANFADKTHRYDR